MHASTCRSARGSFPRAPEPELKVQPAVLRRITANSSSDPQVQVHPNGSLHRCCGRRREEAVDHWHWLGRRVARTVRRQEVEVGERRSSSRCPAVVVVSSGDQMARVALSEPGPVPPVDVHVAPQRLRRPEPPPAVAAGVGGRRRPREAPAGQDQVVARRPRRCLLLEDAAMVLPLHCWWCGSSLSFLSYTS
jgi:hypothetical protein